jgi:hypothetical protein
MVGLALKANIEFSITVKADKEKHPCLGPVFIKRGIA